MTHTFKTLGAILAASLLVAAMTATGCSSATITVVDDGGATSTSDGGSSDSSTTASSPNCDTFCAKVTAASCSAAPSCKADCQKQLTETPSTCKTQVEAMVKCSANEGKVTGCDSKGKAKLEGCTDVVIAYTQCLLGGGGGTDGGTADAGKLHCEDLTSGNNGCDTCMDGKCCAQETACLDSPDCLAFYDCLGAGTSQTQCGNDHPKGLSLAQKVTACQDASCKAACP